MTEARTRGERRCMTAVSEAREGNDGSEGRRTVKARAETKRKDEANHKTKLESRDEHRVKAERRRDKVEECEEVIKASRSKEAMQAIRTATTLGALFAAVLLLSDELAAYTVDGLRAIALKVIPTAFPFMILSEIASARIYPESIAPLRWIVTRVLGLPRAVIAPILIGSITGFPIGAKLISEQYKLGGLDRESAEGALAIASNPSPAFVIGTVGVGIFGDARCGIILILSIYSATLMTGLFFKCKSRDSSFSDVIIGQIYDFVTSVKNSASSVLYMSGFILAFYTLSSFIASLAIPLALKGLLILPIEVTGAVIFVGKFLSGSQVIALSLAAFTLGFGGISVACQVASIVSETGISIKKYLPMKLVSGLISAILAAILGVIFA